jgi:uncharacterized protein YbjT (DUF2867 family)
MTIFIAFATSRTSRFVVDALLAHESQPALRLHARNAASATKLSSENALSGIDIVTADSLSMPSLTEAMEGVDVVFYNGPAFFATATAMGVAFIEAAHKAGVKHFVLCSVIHPMLHKLLNHIEKLPIEEYLVESGLPYTILQVRPNFTELVWYYYLNMEDVSLPITCKTHPSPQP